MLTFGVTIEGEKLFFLHVCTWHSLEQEHWRDCMGSSRPVGLRLGAGRAVGKQNLVL